MSARQRKSAWAGAFRQACFIVVCVLIVNLLVRTFGAQLYTVPSDSMEDTLKVGDTVVVSRLAVEFDTVRRSDVIVFRAPPGWVAPDSPRKPGIESAITSVLVFIGLMPDPSDADLVKRVIGLSGDTVECDGKGRFTVDGQVVAEPYLYPGNRSCYFPFRVTVPAGSVWVEGDHRAVSADSRYHRNINDGVVPVGDIIGRVVAVMH